MGENWKAKCIKYLQVINNKGGDNLESIIVDGKEYRKVTVRRRTKYIARDGSAINPIRKRQKATWFLNEDGYPCYGGSVPIHLYVAHAWVDGYFDGAEVNHKDFNKMNNNADNLEWITHEENVKYSVRENSEVWNKGKQGIHNGRATFTEDKVRLIRMMYDAGMSIADILRVDHPELKTVKQYKNLHSTYLNICKRKTWTNLEDIYNAYANQLRRLLKYNVCVGSNA